MMATAMIEPRIVTVEVRVTDAAGMALTVSQELDNPTLDEVNAAVRLAAQAIVRRGDGDNPF